MIGGLVLGFVAGLLVGGGAVLLLRRSRPASPEVAAPPAPSPLAAEVAAPPAPSPLAGPAPAPAPEPAPAADAEPGDDEVKRAIDASAGLLDELETRYRDRPAPAGDDDPPSKPARRRAPRPPKP